jgi:DNA-binding PadR family transcriptional regulator
LTNTEMAVLGLIAEEPCHGYQVEQRIEQRGMREWTEIGFSSIYYLLNKMEEGGWLSSQERPSGDRTARKVYSLTDAGRLALREAVRQRLSAPRRRTGDFDLALANLPVLEPAEVRAALQTCRERLAADIARTQARREDEARFAPAHVLVLFDHALSAMQAEMEWLEKRAQRIESGEE